MGVLAPAANGEIRSSGGIILPRTFETFDKADAATLGPDQTWSELVGDLDVFGESGRIAASNAESFARMEVDLGTPNHFIEALVIAGPTSSNFSTAGLVARKNTSAGSSSCYMAEVDNGNGKYTIYRRSGGDTVVAQVTWVVPTYPYTSRLEVEGTAIRFYINGTLVASGTDGGITTGNFVGVRSYRQTNTNVRYGHITAGPL